MDKFIKDYNYSIFGEFKKDIRHGGGVKIKKMISSMKENGIAIKKMEWKAIVYRWMMKQKK